MANKVEQIDATDAEVQAAKELGRKAALTSDRHAEWHGVLNLIGSDVPVGQTRTRSIMDAYWAAQNAARDIQALEALQD